MGRKQANPPPSAEAQPEPMDGDVIQEGDFAGMTYNDVLEAMSEGIHDILGEASIEGAGAALDKVLGEYLAVVQHTNGDKDAKLFGIRFAETVLPYATLQVALPPRYNEVRKIKGGRK